MARLVIHARIDVDRTQEDPLKVADAILAGEYAGVLVDFTHAAWEDDA